MEGFDVILELNSEGVRQIVRAYWKSNAGTKNFAEIETEVAQLHRIWPERRQAEDIEEGIALFVQYKPQRIAFPQNNPYGFAPGESVDVSIYAKDSGSATVQLTIALAVDVKVEVRYPGPLSAYRKFGDFLNTRIEAIAVGEADVSRGLESGEDCISLDPTQLRLIDLRFLGNAPPPIFVEGINKLFAAIIPAVAGTHRVPLSPNITKLSSGLSIVVHPGHPQICFATFDAGGRDLTGDLSGDARFAPDTLTVMTVGISFGFNGKQARNPGDLRRRRPRLADAREKKQHIALATSNWVFQYFEVVHLESLVRRSYNSAILDRKGEKPNADGSPKYVCERGWAMYDVYDSGIGFTEDSDDGVLVLRRVSGLGVRQGRFVSMSQIYQIQRGLFGLDFMQPDTDFDVYSGFHLQAPRNAQKSEQRRRLDTIGVTIQPIRTDSGFEQFVTIILSVQDLAKAAVAGLTALITWDANTARTAQRHLLDFVVNLLVVYLPVVALFMNLFFPDFLAQKFPDIGLPAIRFFQTDDLIALEFHIDPEADAPRDRNDQEDEGIVFYSKVWVA